MRLVISEDVSSSCVNSVLWCVSTSGHTQLELDTGGYFFAWSCVARLGSENHLTYGEVDAVELADVDVLVTANESRVTTPLRVYAFRPRDESWHAKKYLT